MDAAKSVAARGPSRTLSQNDQLRVASKPEERRRVETAAQTRQRGRAGRDHEICVGQEATVPETERASGPDSIDDNVAYSMTQVP